MTFDEYYDDYFYGTEKAADVLYNAHALASVERGDWTSWEQELGEYDDWLSLL
jgi:hypothetical protein